MNATETRRQAAKDQFYADALAAEQVCEAAQVAARKAYHSNNVTDATKVTYNAAHHAARLAYQAAMKAAEAKYAATVEGN